MSKKTLGIVARVILGLLGVGFILASIDWVDRVEVPAGVETPGGERLAEAVEYQVLRGDVVDPSATGPEGFLLKRMDGGADGEASRFVVPAERVGYGEEGYRPLPGIFSMLRHTDATLLLLGLLLMSPIYIVQGFRWLLLLRARGVMTTYLRAVKLNYVGAFFNFCMPGATGGDVVKAYYAAARSDRRADAVMSIVVDRIVGMLGMILLAGLLGAIILSVGDLDAERTRIVATIAMSVIGILLLLAGGATLYFSGWLHRAMRLHALFDRMPGGRLLHRVDEALSAYKGHLGVCATGVGVSLVIHTMITGSTALAGYAVGMRTEVGLLLTVIPLLYLVGAIPLTPMGVGTMEAVAIALLVDPATATANEVVGMLLIARLYMIAFGLFGGVFIVQGDVHMRPEQEDPEFARELAEVDSAEPEAMAREAGVESPPAEATPAAEEAAGEPARGTR